MEVEFIKKHFIFYFKKLCVCIIQSWQKSDGTFVLPRVAFDSHCPGDRWQVFVTQAHIQDSPSEAWQKSSLCSSTVNEQNQYPWGCSFHPWPCSLDQGSGIAISCGVVQSRLRSSVAVAVLQAGSYSSNSNFSLGTVDDRKVWAEKKKKKKKKKKKSLVESM